MSGRKLRTPSDARRFLLGVEIEAGELAVRLMEAQMGMRRPAGKTPAQILDDLAAHFGADQKAGMLNAAAAAVAYFAECVNNAGGIQ